MTTYIHQLAEWPHFRWTAERLAAPLAAVSRRQGRLAGYMEALGFKLQAEAVLATLTEDVLKSSEIEGKILDKDQVRSSIAKRLGMNLAGLVPADRNVEGVVEMMLNATQRFADPLTKERLLGWHAALFPTGWSGMSRIKTATWRDDANGPMQVVSGAPGRERVHYEAPSAAKLDKEMETFLAWFEGEKEINAILKASIAHLWFVTIHPFEDGNGRIARAIADMALARADNSTQRFYSMSAQIRRERNVYYDMLEATQKGELDITPWLEWFLACLDRAFDGADVTLNAVMAKAEFWKRYADAPLNDRQRKVVNRLLDGFDGKLTNAKWVKLTDTSPDTALRDIQDLVNRGVLAKDLNSGGRSTSYLLAGFDRGPPD